MDRVDSYVVALKTAKSPVTPEIRREELSRAVLEMGSDLGAVAAELRSRLAGMRDQDREARISAVLDDVSLARAMRAERARAAENGGGR